MDVPNSSLPFDVGSERRPLLLLRRAATALAALLAVLAIGATVLAHSGLGAASPAPGSIVGGELTEFQLRYNSTVADVEGSVTDPDGNVIESEWVQDGNLRVAISLAEPLSVPGEHAVRHTSTDVEDGDRVEAAYLFTFDPSAPPPQLEIIPNDEGFPWIWIVLGGGAVVIGTLGWQLSRSLKRARKQAPTA
jgi:methionine-rich copper-binding protein CopC